MDASHISHFHRSLLSEEVSVVCLDFLNIHILCDGGGWLYRLGASNLHDSFSLTQKTNER